MGKAGTEYYDAHLSFDVGIAKIEEELKMATNN
jgi:hypothetical protein